MEHVGGKNLISRRPGSGLPEVPESGIRRMFIDPVVRIQTSNIEKYRYSPWLIPGNQ
jgi:hypothetical protein